MHVFTIYGAYHVARYNLHGHMSQVNDLMQIAYYTVSHDYLSFLQEIRILQLCYNKTESLS